MTLLRDQQQDPGVDGPPDREPSKLWRWVRIAAVLLVVAFVAFWLGTGHGRSLDPTVLAPLDPPSPFAAQSDLSGEPNGCLGGPDPYQAVLPAQQQATLDSAGAVGFARTAFRYLVKPYPKPADLATVIPQIFVNPEPWLSNAARDIPAAAPPPVGTTTKYVRGSESTYRVTTAGQTADVTVDLYLELDHPDGTNGQVVLTQRFLLQVVDGHWRIADAPATDPLPAAGAAGVFYTPGGC